MKITTSPTMLKDQYVLKAFLSAFLLLSTLLVSAQEGREISKSLYFTSHVGNSVGENSQSILSAIVKASQKDKEAVFISLGNNTREDGYPKNSSKREAEENFLTNNLLTPLSGFNGQIIYIPGTNEWNKGGHKNIDDLESFLQDNGEGKFWPNDGCPIERETLSDEVELVMVDSQWYLEDWDKHPYINNKCEIKTRDQFMAAFKDELKDEQNKTVIVALYHSVLSSTRRGFFERMGGFSDQSYFNNEMNSFIGELETIASLSEDVIFISGADKNLQFIMDKDIPQVISGATGKTEKTRAKTKNGDYGSDKPGYAKLNVFKDGSSEVQLFEMNGNSPTLAFTKEIKSKKRSTGDFKFKSKTDFSDTFTSSIYTKEETKKSGFYKWLWGDHYRTIYSRDIDAPVLFLEDLPNNVKAKTAGGGNQSRTLRLIDDEEHEYSLRELRKSAVRFLQSSVDDHYIKDYVRNTVAEDVVQDYYTTAHPYAPFAVADLMQQAAIYHANPEIYYVPKQERLGRFNDSYGDKLYMLEEHVGDENKEFETFGNSEDIISTTDMLQVLLDDKEAQIDEEAYIKARLFDMLIGDWDRHEDQWRWALFTQEDGTELYKPIPRDRDQAFPKYDGALISLAKIAVPALRPMQTYSKNVKSTKWLNYAAFYLDKSFINEAGWDVWKSQAEFLQNTMTDAAIDNAFANLPEGTKDQSIENIKSLMKQRRENLVAVAQNYYDYFKKHEVIVATNKDNLIDISRERDGKTSIEIKDDELTIFKNTYDAKETKEIWLYGLDGDDTFTVTGDGNDLIKLKIFGGEENDIYDLKNARKTKVFDYKSKENTFKNVGSKNLTDSYEINNYDPRKRKYSTNVIFPSIASDPDRGLSVGLADTYTTYSLLRNPFTTQHTLAVNYYSATSGFEVKYLGEFAHFFYNWNLNVDTRFTTDNYATNFFGLGNDTEYDEDDTDIDFNRTRIKQWHVAPSLHYKKNDDFLIYVEGRLESHEVDNTENGFVNDFFEPTNDVFEEQIYAGGEVGLHYNNKRTMMALPRRGMELKLVAGYKTTIDDKFNNKFGYVKPMVSFIYPIHESGAATLATMASAQFNLSDDYEFYHAASVGGNTSLRGFRNNRFQGKSSFYHSTDLRVGLAQFRTSFVPLRLGVTAGFDYGRVWEDNDNSEQWHNSYGGSVFINGFKAITANLGYYVSKEDSRILVSAGFRF
ncbi:hypothetical protein JM84_0867 [Dokdonia sp. Hel_I_63]|uniref:ShlB/FhaC/HecB family hemolysin secretion/activation protein n=1 Tax=Dokdonia sp. Hel_I_63 TaxID=1249996 RepID=UPI00119BC347|nr:ShlB/FhaC/HecB family hemolysin secretion/activation protein [Dokdonia sp. Hel_I_63]TVZ21987.1 hypothetical protein JM84_0867 [Dokdonia sp. Hel_I_63]